jgi:hypothetical protein
MPDICPIPLSNINLHTVVILYPFNLKPILSNPPATKSMSAFVNVSHFFTLSVMVLIGNVVSFIFMILFKSSRSSITTGILHSLIPSVLRA